MRRRLTLLKSDGPSQLGTPDSLAPRIAGSIDEGYSC